MCCRLQPGPNLVWTCACGDAPDNGANALRLVSGTTPRISLQAASVTALPTKTRCGVCPSLTFRGMKPFKTVDYSPVLGPLPGGSSSGRREPNSRSQLGNLRCRLSLPGHPTNPH